jgi:hypothetical protein
MGLFMFNSTKKKIFLVTVAVMMICFVRAQNSWVLKRQQDGIKVYTRSQTNSNIKVVKVECILNATLSQLAAVIFDIATNDQWVYRTKNYNVLKQVNPLDLYYYAEVQTPWPASNRDFIAHIKLSQNPVSKVMVVDAENAPFFVAQKQDIVRIMHSIGKWVVTIQNPNTIKAEYTLFTDPGGNVPSWLMNMFIADGPLESFQKLKEHLKKPVYANISLPGIRNF